MAAGAGYKNLEEGKIDAVRWRIVVDWHRRNRLWIDRTPIAAADNDRDIAVGFGWDPSSIPSLIEWIRPFSSGAGEEV